MTDQDLVNRFNRGKTMMCQDCHKESTLWFGMASPCRYNGGSHRTMIEIDTDEKHEANKLYGAYHGGLWFDRDRFLSSQSPLTELGRTLLKKYHGDY